MAEKRIAKAWEEYRRMVVPDDAGPGQLRDLRMSFYGGATALFAQLVREASPGTAEPTSSDETMMTEVLAELDEYAALMRERDAEPQGHA